MGCLPPRRRAKVGATGRPPRRSTASSVRSSHARCRRRGATWQKRPASSPRTARTCIAVCAGSGSSRRGTWRDDTTGGPPARVIVRRRAPRPGPGDGTARAPRSRASNQDVPYARPRARGSLCARRYRRRRAGHRHRDPARVRRYNAPTTTRLVGRARLPHGNEWRGDVAVRNGTVVVAGRVDGTLLVINGDAILDTGAVVTGDVIVVGGTVARSPTAMVSGELRVYTAPLAYGIRGEEIALAPPDLRRWFRRLGIEKSWGTADSRSSLTLATGGTFNRVEGLPVVFGPLFDWKLHRNVRLRVDALGVFRTAGDFTDKRSDLGYLLRTELRAGETPAYGIEFRAFDDVTPVEDWGLRAGEVGWAAFLFQRDYRDYYLSKGIAVRAFVQPERSLRLDIDVRADGQSTVRARDPWTVFRNDQA